jgi:hypothetical protein
MFPPDRFFAGWCLDLEILDELIGVVRDNAQTKEAVAGKGRPGKVAQHLVLRHGELLDDAVPHPLFRDVGQVLPGQGSGQLAGHVLALQNDLPLSGRPQTGDDFGQLPLTVARYSGQPQDLAGVYFQVHTAQGRGFAVAQRVEVFQDEASPASLHVGPIRLHDDLTPDHHTRQVGPGDARCLAAINPLAVA